MEVEAGLEGMDCTGAADEDTEEHSEGIEGPEEDSCRNTRLPAYPSPS